jgi:hypothetical protein
LNRASVTVEGILLLYLTEKRCQTNSSADYTPARTALVNMFPNIPDEVGADSERSNSGSSMMPLR